VLDTLVISATGATDFVLPLRASVVAFDVNPPGVTFFSVLPGSTVANSLTVTTLSQRLDLFDYYLIGGNQGFSVDSIGENKTTTLSTLELGVTFTAPVGATSGSVFRDTLVVGHISYPNLIYKLEVEAIISSIEVNPSHLDFGKVPFGYSLTESITVSNYGAPINSIEFEGSTHFSYVIDSDWDPATGGDIHVTYAPLATIPYDNAGLTFISASDTLQVGFTGLGTPAPVISSIPTSYNFGQVPVRERRISDRITVILSNSFGSHLTDEGAIVINDPRGLFDIESIEVEYEGASGDTVFVKVAFTPNAIGNAQATLVATATDAAPLSILLQGFGVPASAPSLSPQQATALSAAEASVAPVVLVKEGNIVVSQAPQGSSIQVYNLQGVALKTQTVSSSVEVLETGSFPQSIYLVLVNDQKQVILKKKVLL
jgi:hypothetical protein